MYKKSHAQLFFPKRQRLQRLSLETLIKNWMEETDLEDIWRMQHPDDKIYTWHRNRPSNIFCRLDFFLISFGLVENIAKSQINCGYKSDHSMISIAFIPHQNKRGTGFWKLNCSLLKDLDYIKTIKETIITTAEINHEANPNLLWDTIKMGVRGESIKYGSLKKKEMNNKIKHWEEKIQNQQKELYKEPGNLKALEELELAKNELNLIIE